MHQGSVDLGTRDGRLFNIGWPVVNHAKMECHSADSNDTSKASGVCRFCDLDVLARC